MFDFHLFLQYSVNLLVHFIYLGETMKKISKVFYITIVLIVIAVGYGVINPVHFEEITSAGKAFVASTFGWYYMLIMTALLLLSIFMIFSPYGKIRLGKDTDRPQFSTITWFAMLFSAGMGID